MCYDDMLYKFMLCILMCECLCLCACACIYTGLGVTCSVPVPISFFWDLFHLLMEGWPSDEYLIRCGDGI